MTSQAYHTQRDLAHRPRMHDPGDTVKTCGSERIENANERRTGLIDDFLENTKFEDVYTRSWTCRRILLVMTCSLSMLLYVSNEITGYNGG